MNTVVKKVCQIVKVPEGFKAGPLEIEPFHPITGPHFYKSGALREALGKGYTHAVGALKDRNGERDISKLLAGYARRGPRNRTSP